ncbi:hypothetical protein [Sorangium sp. So ce388]|uniref:hypothetical protein n=1 Tax=Sorangium sp. So ce388 TaxID=3133309 RepID=UPI003F5C1C4E
MHTKFSMLTARLGHAVHISILCASVFVNIGCVPQSDSDESADAIDPQEQVGEIASAATADDIRWAIQHGAASAACAAASPAWDSPLAHAVVTKPSGVSCTAACAANTGGLFTSCRTSIAVGTIRMTQATSYTDIVSRNYRYDCSSAQAAWDEVQGHGVDNNWQTAYCCCYQPY